MRLSKNIRRTCAAATSPLRRFVASRRAAIAVETAFILPIMMTLGFVSFDVVAVIKAQDRAEYAFYSMADAVSSMNGNVTCDTLDRIAKLGWKGYSTGNWGRRDRSEWEFDERGAEDFRFQINGLRMVAPGEPDYNPDVPQAKVLWAFHRTVNTIDIERQTGPGRLMTIPAAYDLPGEFFIFLEGRHFVLEPFGFFGFITPGGRQQSYDYFFSPRYVPEIDLEGPFVPTRCEAD